jgi:hypothetical protein
MRYVPPVSEWLDAVQFVTERLELAAQKEIQVNLKGVDAIAGCVARAVIGELDPTGELALGRLPPVLVPGAGAWLARKGKYNGSDPSSREALATAARRTLAVGWVLASDGGEVVDGRAERDIYNIWAPSFRDAPRNVAGKDFERTLHDLGASIFVEALKEARMTRFLGGSKVNQIGYVISGGGFFLRFIQSSLMDDEQFREATRFWAELMADDAGARARWAWDKFSI